MKTDNEVASVTAALAGILLLLSGVTGASQWERTLTFVGEFLGSSPLLQLLTIILVALGSTGGALVLFGALAFRRNRVRTGKVLVLIGSGFTIFSLLLYLPLQLRHGDLPFAGGLGLGLIGIMLSIVARHQAKPLPLLR